MANMQQLHDGLGLGDRRMSVEVSRAVEVVHAEGIAVGGTGGGKRRGRKRRMRRCRRKRRR